MSYFLATTLALNLLGAVALCYASYDATEEGAEPAYYFSLFFVVMNATSLMYVFFNIL
jgi:hypothetical protein